MRSIDRKYIILIVLLLSAVIVQGQRKRKLNKGTSKRKIEKRQKEADEKSNYNKFNKLQAMGKKSTLTRNDFIWSFETANVVPYKAGDISIVMPSRYASTEGFEMGAMIGSMYFVPNFYVKKRWAEGGLYVASKHQLYSYTPLLHFSEHNDLGILPEASDITTTLSMKHELIFSKPFLRAINCGAVKQPYLIITAAVGYDMGFKLNDAEPVDLDNKFLNPRGGSVMGNSGFGTIRLQTDYLANKNMFVTFALRGLISDNSYNNAIENNAHLRYSLTSKFSVAAGYWLTFTKGFGSPVLPVFDLSYHFGVREGRDKGLFSKKGYRTLK